MMSVSEYNARLEALRTERSSFVNHWTDLGDYILPRYMRFTTSDRNRGDKKNTKIIDSTATLSVRTLMSGMMGGITSPSRPWFELRTQDPDLNEFYPVKVWLDTVRNRLAEMFLASNIYTTLPNTYRDLGVFGTNAFAVLEDLEDGIRCYSFPIGSYFLANSYRGNVDTCFREFQMSARQMVAMFGKDKCSRAVQSLASQSGGDTYVDVVHMVQPNDDYDERKGEAKHKRFKSCYYEKGNDSGEELRESGFDEFPIMASRWDLIGEDIYGTSPAMDALGDIKALQMEQKRKAQAIDKVVNPPMGAPSSLRKQAVSTLPGDITYYDSTTGSNGLAPIYQVNPYLGELKEDMAEIQQRIRRCFFEDLFLMISQDDRSNVTAQEIIARKEEKLLMLGPVLERLNDELLDPLIDRSFNIGLRNGMFPPPPPELQGQDLSVEYVSVMAQAMKLAGIQGIERLASFAGQLSGAYPEALDAFNPDVAIDSMGRALAVPPKLLRDQAQRDQMRQARAQQAQMQQSMAMAQAGAQTAQTLADTNVTDPNALTQMMQTLRGGM